MTTFECDICGGPATEIFQCAAIDAMACDRHWRSVARSLLVHGVSVEAVRPVVRAPWGSAWLGDKARK